MNKDKTRVGQKDNKNGDLCNNSLDTTNKEFLDGDTI